MTPFEALHLPQGFLTDRHIKLALKNQLLLVPGTWVDTSIRHASYTLRLGHKIEVARSCAANKEERRDFTVQDLKVGDSFDLQPGDTAKLFSIEILHLPKDVLAFTVARGLMFFEALVPENTYADPGFNDTLYTTVTNASNRIVRLDYGDPIARLFFYHLSEQVEEPFQRGAAKGIKQRLESSRATTIGTAEECTRAKIEELLGQLRHLPIAGNAIVELNRRQNRKCIGAMALAAVWPVLMLVANTNSWVKAVLGSLWSNVSAAVLSAAISFVAPRLWSYLKKYD